ncbi:MAG: 16S rRNA (cytidine(1402)-2'-O)-methyltransferase [Rhodovibrionaceae bacterium]
MSSPSTSKPAAADRDRGRGGQGSEGAKLAPGLYLVATPIGNLKDITLRALETLAAADLVLCEDTRVSAKLLRAHGLSPRLRPYHEHNAARIRPQVIQSIKNGEAVALISDAGTPLVSDPGYKLVRACQEEELPVTALPGPSAALAALLLSGLPSDRFFFAGFLPAKSAARKTALSELAAVPGTLIFFESQNRLAAALADMAETLGDREAAVLRELTKLFEEARRGRLSELAARYAAEGPPKGEIAIAVAPPETDSAAPSESELDSRLRDALASGSLRDAVDRIAAETGLPRKRIYARALELEKEK